MHTRRELSEVKSKTVTAGRSLLGVMKQTAIILIPQTNSSLNELEIRGELGQSSRHAV